MVTSSPLDPFKTYFGSTLAPTIPLASVYADDVVFEDPLHRATGLAELGAYFERLNRNVRSARFTFTHEWTDGGSAALAWTLELELRRPARAIRLPGMSRLEFGPDGRIRHQRDYFDAGALVYEQIPLLGRVIRSIKTRL